MYTLKELQNIDKLNEFRDKYRNLIPEICWSCPGAIEKALNLVKLKNNYHMSRLVKYKRKERKDRYGNITQSHIYTNKPIKGVPSTILPIDDTDEICSILEKELPDLFNAHYERIEVETKKSGKNKE